MQLSGEINEYEMKRIVFLLVGMSLLLGACNSSVVKVRGKVQGLEGTVKLMAELPGERGLVVLDQKEVKNGDIDLRTDKIVIPARVWVDIDGKRTMDMILDTRDMIWIDGKIKFPDQIQVKGSGLMDKYNDLKKKYKQQYQDEIDKLNERILKISKKEKMTRDDEVLLGVHQLRKQRLIGQRAEWTKALIEKNADQDISLFLIKDELVDSLDAQKKMFQLITVPNTESNIYKVLESRLQ